MAASQFRFMFVGACLILFIFTTVSFTSPGHRAAHRVAHRVAHHVANRAPGFSAWWTGNGKIAGVSDPALPYDAVRHHHIDFRTDRIPETKFVASSPGFHVIDNLYIRNGKMFIYNSNSTGEVPPLQTINSCGQVEPDHHIPELIEMFTGQDEAMEKLGGYAGRMSGVTMMFNDDWSGMRHMPHFTEEAFFGSWKIYSTVADKENYLPLPDRLWLPKLDEQGWRDPVVLMNPYLLRSAFPHLGMLYKNDWDNIASFGNTLVLERVILFDRYAAHKSPENNLANKVVETIALLPGPDDWWEPVRKSIVAASIGGRGGMALPTLPVITYISRQHADKRRFKAKEHAELVKGLEELALDGQVEVNIVEWETMSRQNQIAVASRTTIMIGIHGSGLTHELWMPPHPKSMVIEAFKVDGYARDFGIVAQMLGHRHVSTWNERTFDFGELAPQMIINDGFHGREIELSPPTILRLVKEQLGLRTSSRAINPIIDA